MANSLGFYAAAGALAGVGSGLVEEAKRDFQVMQDELRARRAAAEAQKGRDFQGEQGRLTREQQVTLQNDRQTFEEGQSDLNRRQQREIADKQIGATRERADDAAGKYTDDFQDERGFYWQRNAKGESIPVKDPATGQQIKGPLKAPARDPDKLSAAQRGAAIRNARRVATAKDAMGNEKVDWEVYADELIGQDVQIDAGIREQIENGLRRQLADEVKRDAEKRTGILTSEASEFEGGTRAEWERKEIDRRVTERMARITGEVPAAKGDPATGGKPPAAAAPAGKPDGTQANPYRPTTREAFDALPSGTIYVNPADGKPYRKN